MQQPPNNPLRKKVVSPIYQKTEEEPVSQAPVANPVQAETSQQPSPPAPTTPPQAPTQPVAPLQTSVVQSAPMPIVVTQGGSLMYPSQGFGQPSSHDMRSEVPFEQRYKKDNVQVDKRLYAAYADYMSRVGRSKVDAFNRMMLEVLLRAGYSLDPNVLDRPFKFEDLPK